MKKSCIIIIVLCVVLALSAALYFFKFRGTVDGPKLIHGFSEADGQQVMLIDFCKKTVATVGGDGYSETVLYQNRDGSCEVHYYSKYEGDTKESHSAYSVDKAVIAEAYEIINQNKIAAWNEKYNGPGMDGAIYVLKFRTNSGDYIRATSDNMPDDGIAILYSVNDCMNSFVKEDAVLPN